MDTSKVKGYRTYIVSIATVCYALGGWVAGYVDPSVAIPLILGALGLSGLRGAFLKPEEKSVTPSPGNMPQ